MEVQQGELVTPIGANGAGKTTTIKAITGLKPYSVGRGCGRVSFRTAASRWCRKAAVSSRACQSSRTCRWARTCNDTDGIKKDVKRMFGFFLRLKERATQLAGTLSRGELQMLAMARAISSMPPRASFSSGGSLSSARSPIVRRGSPCVAFSSSVASTRVT
jgi:branched-chain amino acid transport system ATP-binding protein